MKNYITPGSYMELVLENAINHNAYNIPRHSVLKSWQQFQSIKIPRWLGAYSPQKVGHVGFVIHQWYIITTINDTVHIILLTAKTKVAPVQTLSLPSLKHGWIHNFFLIEVFQQDGATTRWNSTGTLNLTKQSIIRETHL